MSRDIAGYMSAVHHLAWLAAADEPDARGWRTSDGCCLVRVAEETDRPIGDHVGAYLLAAADLLDLVDHDAEHPLCDEAADIAARLRLLAEHP